MVSRIFPFLVLVLAACDSGPLAAEGARATLCAGVQADSTGRAPAGAAIQSCISATAAGGVLELPAGVYRIDRQLLIDRPITLRTAGADGRGVPCGAADTACAVLRADAGFRRSPAFRAEVGEHGGILDVVNTSDVRLEYLVLDGNRRERLGSDAAQQCRHGYNRFGFNASVRQSARVQFRYSASVNALCGTGLEWFGDDAVVENSLFQDNGDLTQEGMWADGLTVLQSDRARVTDSRFVDNSDLGLIVGGSRDGMFSDNAVVQERQAGFGGLMLYNFSGFTSGDFTGAVFERNVVYCSWRRCNFAIQVGGHPWLPGLVQIIGGTVRNNVVFGGMIGINVDGAGTAAQPTHLHGNSVQGVAPVTVTCLVTRQRLTTAPVNIAPDAVVNRHGETAPVASTPWHQCERFSPDPFDG